MKTALVLSLALIACGGAVPPVAGGGCEKGSQPKCIADGGAALFCEAGKWQEFPCAEQCYVGNLEQPDGGRYLPDAGDLTICLLPNIDAGQPCPTSWAEQFGYCAPEAFTPTTPANVATCVGGIVTLTECRTNCNAYSYSKTPPRMKAATCF